MHPRTKLVSTALVLLAGLVSATLFRRVEPLPSPPPHEPSALVLPRRPSSPSLNTTDKPLANPVVRLLGRIMPVDESSSRTVSVRRERSAASIDAQLQFTDPPSLPPNPRRLPSGGLLYTVEPADTLRGLAYRFLGSAEHWPLLEQENRGVIIDREHLTPGIELQIPRSSETAAIESEPSTETRPMMPISRPRAMAP